MKTTPQPPNPKALTLPLRDMLSGIRQMGLVPEPVAKTALDTLPKPIRTALREIAGIDTEDTGLDHPAHTPLYASAARALRSGSGSSTDVAKASALAIRHLTNASSERPILVSETVLALCWAQAEETAQAAARFATEIKRHAPFGETPGLPSEQNDGTEMQRKEVALALCIWLLAERADSDIKESDLLGISRSIASDLTPLAAEHWGSAEALQESLLSAAARI